MSSLDEVSVWGADLGPESGERGGVLRGPGRDLEVWAPQSGEGEGEGGLPVLEGPQAEQQVMDAAGAVLWGRRGRSGSPDDEKEDALDYTPHIAEESAAIAKQPTDRETPTVQRNPSYENRALQMSSIWADLEKSSSGRSVPSPSCEKSQQASPRGWAWGNRRRGPRSRLNIPLDLQQPSKEGMIELPSDPESSDDFSEIQLIRVNIYPKGGRHAKSSSPEDLRDTSQHLNPRVRENLFHGRGSFQASTPRGLTSAMDRQPVGEPELFSAKKMQSVVSGKRGSRPSYTGAAVVGSLPHATTKKKVAQEKKSGSGASKGALGRKYQSFPVWGQRVSGDSLAPDTFPPISGLPLPGSSKRYSLVHLATKQSKHSNAGNRPVSCRTRESELVSRDENDPSRDPLPKGQDGSVYNTVPGPSSSLRIISHAFRETFTPGCHDPELSSLSMRHGEFSGGDPKTRSPQVPGSSQPLVLIQGGINPRGPAPSGHQEPLDLFRRHEKQQQPPEAQGCPGCLMRQKEIDDLKHQLAVMQSLTDKFQVL